MTSRFTQYVLDTNMLRPLTDENDVLYPLVHRYYDKTFLDAIWIPDIVLVESLRGGVNSVKDGDSDKVALSKYQLFRGYFHFLKKHQILEFNEAALVKSQELRSGNGAKGTRDRRIAASALARNFSIVTRNTKDFIALGVPSHMLVDWSLDRSLTHE